jgi:hypothetical protein
VAEARDLNTEHEPKDRVCCCGETVSDQLYGVSDKVKHNSPFLETHSSNSPGAGGEWEETGTVAAVAFSER